MRFANPQILWFLLVIPPAFVGFIWWSLRKRQQLIAQFIQARLLPTLTVGISPGRRQLRYAAILVALICLIVALARPQWGFAWEEVKQRGLDIVVAIDTSRSMLAEDVRPNRLARAKLAALDLMRLAKADRLGLVAFAGGAFLQCPLTIDDSAFRQSLEALDVNIIPQGGTALSEAIDAAQTAFKEGDNHRILVILTDGEDHDSGAVEAAKTAAAHDMEIFTIGIGTPKGELLTVKDAKGRTDYIRDSEGHVVQSKLNEPLLRDIASATAHGFYLPLQGATTMETVYKEGLAPLPKSESAEKLVKRYYERYHWPLAIAISLLLLEMALPEKRRSPKTSAADSPVRTPAIAAPATALLILLALAVSASASPSSAMRSYQSGDYKHALKEYERLLEKNKDDARLHFNAGAAAYRDKKYDDAIKQFNESLNSPDLKLQGRSYYNLGNTLFSLGAAAESPDERSKSWEEAIKNYENSIRLEPQDADAKFNHDYVQKLLEELKKQQQQQKQNQDNKDNKDNKDDKDQQNHDKKNDQKQNQDKKDDQSKQQQNEDKKDQQQQQQDQQQSKKDDQKKQEQQKQDQAKNEQQKKEQEQKEKDQQQQKGQKPGDKDKDQQPQDQQPGQAYAAGQMTPREARQLLDSFKGEEMVMPIKPELKQKPPNGPVKDW